MHATKYAVVYIGEDGRERTFKTWADDGRGAVKNLFHAQGVTRDRIVQIDRVRDGRRERVG